MSPTDRIGIFKDEDLGFVAVAPKPVEPILLQTTGQWVLATRQERIHAATHALMDALDVHVPGTAERVARFWDEWLSFDAGASDVTFEEVTSDDLVAVHGMRLWSMCEHHLLPFEMEVSVGYVPSGKVIGLSKIARIAQRHAHKLQVQERYVRDVATELGNIVGDDVAVIARGEHLCLAMRGIRTPAIMHASAMWGKFREKGDLRAEFLALVGAG